MFELRDIRNNIIDEAVSRLDALRKVTRETMSIVKIVDGRVEEVWSR